MKNSFLLFTYSVLMLVFYSNKAFSQAQNNEYNVAIFLYQGVEILDFAGPTEVFAATNGFNVYTVSVDGKDILSQGLVTIKPEFSIQNAPKPDIIVFPGGSSSKSSKDESVLTWAKKTLEDHGTVLTVCTGAFIVAGTGLADTLTITTHYGSINSLRETLPNATVLENTRFVDNDRIITTAGVSAGIDGALHLVRRIKGPEVAKGTARYMEYDKWHPEEGKIASVNPVIREMNNQAAGKGAYTSVPKEKINHAFPYEAEFVDAVARINENGKYQQAADWVQLGLTWYPGSSKLYEQLRISNSKLKKPVPPDEASLIDMVDKGQSGDALVKLSKAMKEFPGWTIFNEESMNLKGYDYLQKGQHDKAIAAFQLNTTLFPGSWNGWDSLAEGYMEAGSKQEAIRYYEKSVELNPGNENGKRMLSKLKL